MTPPLAPPGLDLHVGPIIVSQGMALEERTEVLGMGGLAQPDQRLDLQLVDTLFGQAEACADAAKGRRRLVTQAIVRHNNGTQAVG